MFSIITNLTKAAVAVVATPVALVVDVVKLPVTAFEDRDPFTNTSKMLNSVGKSVSKAVE
jgi:hypothetical protein